VGELVSSRRRGAKVLVDVFIELDFKLPIRLRLNDRANRSHHGKNQQGQHFHAVHPAERGSHGFEVRIRFRRAGAGEANCGIEGIGSAMGNASGKADTAPTRLRSGLASVSTQMQRLQSLWVAFQGLQLFGAGIKGMVGPIPAHAGPPGPA